MDALERDLVWAAKRGDRDAFRVLAERHYERVYRMLLAWTRNSEAALDLTQEAFVKALQGLPDFDMGSSFYTWLHRIARNAAVDWSRKGRRHQGREVPLEAEPEPIPRDEQVFPVGPPPARNPEAAVESEERVRLVRRALDGLKPIHREILLLREVQGLSYEEIAQVLGVRAGTVMSRLFAARMAIRRVLEDQGGVEP